MRFVLLKSCAHDYSDPEVWPLATSQFYGHDITK